MSGQRARSAVPVDHRSAHPNIAGVPWWGAILIAVVGCSVGFAFDAGSGTGQLTSVFAVLYTMGCLTAVLAVRQSGVFTAAIQPPLLLFIVVPGAYFLMHSSEIHGIKDILINCGYPLIERFPLMFFTSAAVLLFALARWYLGRSSQKAAATGTEPARRSRLSATVSSQGGGADNDDASEASQALGAEPRRRHSTQRRQGAADTAKGGRPGKRTAAPSRSRHARPTDTESSEPAAERPRRRRPRPSDQPPTTAEPRRRSRPSSTERDRRGAVPPSERRGAYDRRERPERERAQRPRPQRRSRYEGYEPPDPYGQSASGASGTHHPVSRVRYRGSDQAESGTRRRTTRDVDADRWEYDI